MRYGKHLKAAGRKRFITALAVGIFMIAGLSIAQTPAPAPAPANDIVSIFEALEARPNDVVAAVALEKYIETVPRPDAVDEALLRLGRIRAGKKDYSGAAAALQRLLTDYPASRFKFDAIFDLASVRHATGADVDARSLSEAVLMNKDSTATLRAKAGLLLKSLDAPVANIATTPTESANLTPAIGALLPLKGSYAQWGADALKGILLAANTFGATGQPIEVLTRDVESSGSRAASAVTELAATQRVTGLVGPLLSSSALDAAKAAQANKIPVIALSQRDDLTETGEFVYRNFLTPQVQASYLAGYACTVMGRKNFIIIYPQNTYGVELAKYFSAEVLRQGCTVASEQSYPPGTADFSQSLRQAFAVKVKERKEGRRVIKEYTPGVQADALYVPDTYESAALIAPYLEYYNITGLQLLGSNAWNSPKLTEGGGKHLEGAVFVDAFFAESLRPQTMDFVTRFKEVYGTEPGVIEAEAYDATMMLIASMTGAGADRATVNARLRALKDFKGATGDLSFNGSGEVKRRLFLLTVKGGRIIEAEATPANKQ